MEHSVETAPPDHLPRMAEAGNRPVALTDHLVALAVEADEPGLRAVAWRITASRERIAWLGREEDPAQSRTIQRYEAQAQAAEAGAEAEAHAKASRRGGAVDSSRRTSVSTETVRTLARFQPAPAK